MKNWFIFFLFLVSYAYTTKAFAYPEMIRQNYVNCLACHESPSGGGLLTPYGRGLSAELLSTWGGANEAKPFYGAFDHPFLKNWFNVGGDLRAVQFHTKNSQGSEDKFIRMQTGIETSLKYMKVKFVSFFGKQEVDNMVRGKFLRFFLQYQAMDELTVRAGRFIPNFGINIAEHILATRRGLGFDEGTERNQVEAMWSGENWNTSVSFSKQVKSDENPKTEKAGNIQLNYSFLDSYRVGGDLWVGNLEGQGRQIVGAHALLGFTKKFYYLTEFDFQKDFEKKKGLFHFSKLGYEFFKGFHGIILEDYQKEDFKDSLTLANSFGAGLEWYPRPHFEFEGVWSKKRVAIQSDKYSDYAYLMMHYYF
ncbi:MAG: hypothetical protein H7281_13060 [Bacteriovorax sp.]|nr:hypothetical protein [Bacteriovorax sp.]